MIQISHLLRGGRLSSVRKDVVNFTSSRESDRRLLKPVIQINEAHVIMLMEQEIITRRDGTLLLQGLRTLGSRMKLPGAHEDVHMEVEEAVIKSTGLEIGGNLHIAKSRNDQVSTAIRMVLRKNLLDLMTLVINLQETLTNLAEKHVRTLVPGYTHLRPAQPITFAHYLLSYVDTLERDGQRLEDAYHRVNLCPMGAGALATSSFQISRERVAELLGFSEVLENSVDAVSSRDFILEPVAALAILAVNISRLVEDFILESSPAFGIIELPDGFTFTSSIMPQKKNPDVLEVIRAKMSHVIGNFFTSVTTMKALPTSYNMDFQEITPRLWEALDDITRSLNILSKLIERIKVTKNAFEKPHRNFSTSTELANLLVRKYKIPFRKAHKLVGCLVRLLIEQELTFADVTSELIKKAVQAASCGLVNIDLKDVQHATTPLTFVDSHSVRGGPSPAEVKRMLKIRKKWIEASKSNGLKKKSELDLAEEKLQTTVKRLSGPG